jgi:hypothetical protein
LADLTKPVGERFTADSLQMQRHPSRWPNRELISGGARLVLRAGVIG